MLNEKVAGGREPTEQELQDIAKAMYGELLSSLCTDQRATPVMAEYHPEADRACVDYFERLKNPGGHCSFLPDEERVLRESG